ncbi:MAG: right-handed parallel beta-helix repeat-containing protein [Syntrophorhabdaceae bacterium]|nr:right-handed parallel beta-helix repeat-containing protein [Syntrophorhabdaceae bacterium]
MRKIVILSIPLLLALAVASADAADFYVSVETGGAGRSADGSKAQPWKDLQVALDRANPGDTIHIAGGNYLGTSDRGYHVMEKPVSLRGGYSNDFSSRDVLGHLTMIQPPASSNKTAQNNALLSLGNPGKVGQFKVTGEITIDGIVFDRGLSNGYHPAKGKPAGVETGMLVHAPGQGVNGAEKNVLTIKKPLIAFVTGSSGDITIQNCVFANSGFYGILGTHVKGKVTIKNNIFVANTFAAVEISGQTGQNANTYKTEIDFSNNTVLFSWSRTNDLGDMGYGYRFMTGVNTIVRNCIIGTSVLAGLERTRTDSTAADAAKRKTGAENNAFFLNRKGDLYTFAGSNQMLTVWAKNFEDREEIDPYQGNIELTGDKLKSYVNRAYLEGFIGMVYSESMDYRPDSPANNFRRAFGMNQVATVTNKVDMYANCYPLGDALKLFGALQGYGAQAIEN